MCSLTLNRLGSGQNRVARLSSLVFYWPTHPYDMEALTLLQQAFHHAAIDYRFPSQSVPDQAPSLIGGRSF